MKAGEKYYLLVNNYNSSRGFSITIETDASLTQNQDCQDIDSNQELQINTIFPIPSTDVVNINYTCKDGLNVKFANYDVYGSMYREFTDQQAASQSNFTIDIESLPPGEFILVATQNAEKSTKRFIKI